MSEYFEQVKPTYLENWPAPLCSLSLRQSCYRLNKKETLALARHVAEFGPEYLGMPGSEDGAELRRITEALEKLIGVYPSGVFARLGSRSPKDSWLGNREGFKACTGKRAIELLTDCSGRVFEDLYLALKNDYEPHIFVRQWLDFEPWQEFRCFMEKRKLVGISQYNYLRGAHYPQIEQNAPDISRAINQFFQDFQKLSHLDSVIFDLIVFPKNNPQNSLESAWEVVLLEINPWFEMTDPCLYSWKEPFAGGLRYNSSEGTVVCCV